MVITGDEQELRIKDGVPKVRINDEKYETEAAPIVLRGTLFVPVEKLELIYPGEFSLEHFYVPEPAAAPDPEAECERDFKTSIVFHSRTLNNVLGVFSSRRWVTLVVWEGQT